MTFIALAGVIAEGATAALVGTGLGTAAGATAVGAGGVGLMGAGTTAALASGIGAAGAGALGGAGLGALGSAITGGDVGKGALYGALGGGITGGLSSAVGALPGSAASTAPGSVAAGTAPPVAGAPLTPTGSFTGFAGSEAPIEMGDIRFENALKVGQLPPTNIPNAIQPSAVQMAAQAAPTAVDPYAGTLFGQHPLMTIGAGSMLGNYLGGDSGPTQATPPGQPWNPLSYYKFDPRRFQPSRPTYIRTGYANGGIASLTSPDPAMMQSGAAKVNFMGEDAYPTSQQKLNFYASPTQMPTSAQQAMASYEPSTNPLTGEPSRHFASGGISDLGHYSDGGNLTRGPGDGVSDDIPATIAGKQPARLADGEFVVPARAVSELGNGSTEAGAKRLYAMVDQIQNKRKKSMGKKNIAVDSKARAALPV